MVQTFHSKQFSSIEELKAQKKRKNTTISVVIPALNEAATIGPIISRIRTILIEQNELIDEIVVIDGISEDETARIAKDAGAVVYNLDDIQPSILHRGKGVAMWKSQFVTRGDIVIFIDSDILDFDERFICGLAGPLLFHDNLSFAKAFYKRPLLLGTGVYENQGGRVTEIMVRPLLSTLVPELAHLYQPLAGEYALRRNLMESLPFWSGYGVEIGLLFDIFYSHGLSHIAQVDMDKRCHRNRNVNELGKMAFAIMQVIFSKLEKQGLVSFKQFSRNMISISGQSCYESECNEFELLPRKLFN